MAAWVFSSCGEWGLPFVAVCWLTAVAALVDEYRLWGERASVVAAPGL